MNECTTPERQLQPVRQNMANRSLATFTGAHYIKYAFPTPFQTIGYAMPFSWTQEYTPVFSSLTLSALVAALPAFVLLGSMTLFKVKAHVAALLGLTTAVLVAVFVYGMPAPLAAAAALYGAAFGLLPIGWIVLCAIFVYDITVTTGTFAIVRESITSLAEDRRIQVLLIAYCFGAFIEGAAGFGTPVAISAAILIGIGFKPLPAAGLALIGNTVPVAYAAMGTPIIALSAVTGLPVLQLSATVGRQLPLFCILIPFWIVSATAGFRQMLEVWPACLVAGSSFAATQFLVSNYHGPWMVGIASSTVSMLALVVLLKFWRPRRVWRFPHDAPANPGPTPGLPTRKTFTAWIPWALLSLFVFIWGFPETRTVLDSIGGFTVFHIPIPVLNMAVFRTVPVVPVPRAEEALFTLNWLSATGTSLLFAGIFSGFALKLRPAEIARVFGKTFLRVGSSLATIAAMMAIGFTIRYAGLDATIGLAFAATGVLFPFFSPILGWIGVMLTGSDTSSNVLFGNLQQITAERLHISPLVAAAANSSGGVMGKMINAQSIVVAAVATNQVGEEGTILRSVFWHSVALVCLVGFFVLLQVFLFPATT
jgi:lactate permease